MGKPKVLLLGKIDHAHDAWSSLSQHADIVTPFSSKRSEFIEECKTPHLSDTLALYRTFDSVAVTGIFDGELVNSLPPSLKFIAHNGAGYDQIHIAPCTARGIRVSNVPTAVDDSTADTALFLLLGALRNLNGPMAALRDGNFRGEKPPALGHDPQGKLLGVLGMGGIGRNFAGKARALGMRVAYHNRRRLSEEQSAGAEYLAFEDLLRQADVLSVHVPLSEATRHMLSRKEFEIMKKGAVVVNTARGAVIDEAALVEALKEGQIASAGLDVFEGEPEVCEGLRRNPNVMLLPHMGTWTLETQMKMEEWCIGNLEEAVLHGRLRSIVPEQEEMQE